MLAAESAWRVLRAEHKRIRELLASVDQALGSGEWKHPGPKLAALRQRIQELQAFDEATHRPKGHMLLATLRGRSPEVDGLVEGLQRDREQCDQLLARAAVLMGAIEGGDERAADELAPVLAQHRDLMRHHLDLEDQVLHAHTAELLTPQEWSSVVSSISSVVASTRRSHPRR